MPIINNYTEQTWMAQAYHCICDHGEVSLQYIHHSSMTDLLLIIIIISPMGMVICITSIGNINKFKIPY